jgi:hypothetical protein
MVKGRITGHDPAIGIERDERDEGILDYHGADMAELVNGLQGITLRF